MQSLAVIAMGLLGAFEISLRSEGAVGEKVQLLCSAAYGTKVEFVGVSPLQKFIISRWPVSHCHIKRERRMDDVLTVHLSFASGMDNHGMISDRLSLNPIVLSKADPERQLPVILGKDAESSGLGRYTSDIRQRNNTSDELPSNPFSTPFKDRLQDTPEGQQYFRRQEKVGGMNDLHKYDVRNTLNHFRK